MWLRRLQDELQEQVLELKKAQETEAQQLQTQLAEARQRGDELRREPMVVEGVLPLKIRGIKHKSSEISHISDAN